MILVEVVGSVTSTIKDEALEGFKLLVVQAISTEGAKKKDYYIAVDTVGLGEGEIGLMVRGSTARQTVMTKKKSVDASLIAKVDRLDLETGIIDHE